MKKIIVLVFTFFSFSLFASQVETCKPKHITTTHATQILDLYDETIKSLEKDGTEFALVSRIGVKNPYIKYTHMAFLWKSNENWTITHILRHCDEDSVELYNEGLAEFFTESRGLKVIVFTPPKDTQKKMTLVLKNNEVQKFINPKFSIISNAWSTDFQNCTQFILEVYAYISADYEIKTREDAVDWYKKQGFKPTMIKAPAALRAVANVSPFIIFDDHPNKSRLEFVTADNIMDFIKKREPSSTTKMISLEGESFNISE